MASPVGAAIAQNPDASGVKLNIHPLDGAYTVLIGETCTQGDVINLFTDGATYYAEGLSGIDDAFTTS